jgi:N-acetylglucosaminyl-diphospho-decaprenol L-rhamnosyltransferase
MSKKVDIIIVNWNAGQKSLNAAGRYLDYTSSVIACNVIVVDNGSTDNSVLILKNKIKNLIINEENLGFGKACNQAFKTSTADYVLLLNPDTQSETSVLENLVEFLEINPDYGIIGPGQIDKDGNLLRTCGRFPTFKTAVFELLGLSKAFPQFFTPAPIMTDWDHLESRNVDHVMGSYSLIRKSILDKIGFMDESFFVYMEDMDLSKRVRDFNFKIFYTNQYTIFHESGGTGEGIEEYRLFYSLHARFIYWKKYFGKSTTIILSVLSLTVEPLLRIANSIIKEKRLRVKKIAKAYFLFVKSMLNGSVPKK